MKYTVLFFLLLSFLSCKEAVKDEPVVVEVDDDLLELVSAMTGSFSSENQAALDSTYFNISLHMYPIWPEKNGHWLYVEQALFDKQEEPYRQRIYKVSRENDSVLKSETFTFPNEALWICKWQTPEFFDKLLIESLLKREGCDVLLKKSEDNVFVGKTNDKSCLSDLQGATYVTTEVEISEKKIISWDRGFNAQDSLVWGASQGGYIFNKL